MRLESLSDTRTFAAELLTQLPPGALLILDGPLGAGKTTLVSQIAALLDSPAQVSSPSYTLIHEYPSPGGTLVHIDAYRLDDSRSLIDLGLDEYLERARLVVIEWGAGLAADYPEAYMVRMARTGEVRSAELIPPRPGPPEIAG